MSGRKFRIGIAIVIIFFIGFYWKPISNYFNTINTIIALLFIIIVLLLFWIEKLKSKVIISNNSYSYYDGQNNILRRELKNSNKTIELQRTNIIELNKKIEENLKYFSTDLNRTNDRLLTIIKEK